MTERVDAGWSVREFHGLDLGDARLNRRLLIMAEAFRAQPAAPINQASADWQSTKAAYAFFARERALPAEILLPHQQRTLERMAAHAPSSWPERTPPFSTSPIIQQRVDWDRSVADNVAW